MANCEETPCVNVQSAICLHCDRRLCALHIVEHGAVLLKQDDELCEQINELSEQLNVSLQQIHLSRQEAMDRLELWRQKQIDKVEHKYAEKIQIIEFRKDNLTELENELTQRLIKEVKEPLENMQTRQSANVQNLQTIRQVIENITRDSTQFELYSNNSSVTVTDENHLSQSNSSQQQPTHITTTSSVNSSKNSLGNSYFICINSKITL
jgi:hypothetical protein